LIKFQLSVPGTVLNFKV